ncbi:unnamed protein product, partial [Parnassius mnemosyne]
MLIFFLAQAVPDVEITAPAQPLILNVRESQSEMQMRDHLLTESVTMPHQPSTSGVQVTLLDIEIREQLHAESVTMPAHAVSSTCCAQETLLDIEMRGCEEYGKQKGHNKQHKRKSTKPKGPYVPLTKLKQFNSILKQLKKCEDNKMILKRKYILAKKMTRTTAFEIVSSKMSATAKIFCQMQASQSGKKKHGRRFTLDEKILALSLYKPAPKAYRLLSNLCVLPSKRTLQNLLHNFDLNPGVNELIFDNLKNRVSKLPDNYKYCSLLFDEMAIGTGLTYDKKKDKILGFVDNGEKIECEFCDHVLVFMIRGIVKKYKQPIAYYYCSGSTKAVELKVHINNIVKKVQKTGLKVVATICDQGTSNVAAITMLIKETQEVYVRNGKIYREGFFKVGNDKIFPLYDPPHLIKGIRNNLITKDLKYTMKGKECTAKWSHIVQLYNRCPGYRGVKLVPKLTAHHVLPHLIPKMRVKHCTQVFSQSVGVGLACMAELGALDKSSYETADLLLFFDDLFDSVNGSFSEIIGGKKYRAAVTPTSPHHNLWNYSIPILKSMKFVSSNSRGVVPSLSSWIQTIENFKNIVKFLNSKGINSLLLRNFNQDPLENFFGAIRAHGYSNIMPTSSAFEGAFKTLLINNITSSHSVGSNCEKDDSVCLQSLKCFLINPKDNNTATECEDEVDYAHLYIDPINTDALLASKTPMDIEKCAAIGYCSGWIAQLAKKHVFKNCITCRHDLEAEDLLNFHKFIKMKEYENKKWLCYPTRALFDFFAQVEHISIEILKDRAKNYISKYIKLIMTVNLNFNFLTCLLHKNDLTDYLINKSTFFFINNWCKDVNNVLTGKITFWDVNDPMKEKAHRHYSKNKGRKRIRQNNVSVINSTRLNL